MVHPEKVRQAYVLYQGLPEEQQKIVAGLFRPYIDSKTGNIKGLGGSGNNVPNPNVITFSLSENGVPVKNNPVK